MKKYIIFILLVIPLFSKEFLTIGVTDVTRDLPEIIKFKEILEESLLNLGYDVNYIYLPSLRSISDANRGEIDGDMPKAKEIIKLYKNVFQVDVEIDKTSLYAYTFNPEKISSFKDFENKKIGTVLGFPVFEDILMKNVEKYSIEKLKDIYALRNMLINGRVDLLFLPEPVGEQLMNEYPKDKFKKSEKPIYEILSYLNLNKKHLKLKEPLEKEIKKIIKIQN